MAFHPKGWFTTACFINIPALRNSLSVTTSLTGIVRRLNYNSGVFHLFLSPFGIPWWKTLRQIFYGNSIRQMVKREPVLVKESPAASPSSPSSDLYRDPRSHRAWKSVKLRFRSSPPGLTSWHSMTPTCSPCQFQGQNHDAAFSLRKEKREAALIRKIMVRSVKSTEFLASPQELCSPL